MAYGSSLGFATVGANGGHNGTSGRAFLNHPEVLKDLVFRSIHTNVVIGKQVTEIFYGVPHTKSYYLGCSTGGRQGLKSVQDFPDDFDGVIAGAAAADYNHLQGRNGNFFLITGPSNASTFLSVSQWVNIVHPNVLKQCDGIDKVLNGIIEDPTLCDYDPSELICRDNVTTNCISEAQAETVRKVFSPFFLKGRFAFPRVEPGTESLPQRFASGSIFNLTADWFRFVVFSDPNFDVTMLGPDDRELAQKLDPFNVSTFKGDISTFKNRNGKLITYHGTADEMISPGNTPRYYEHVSRTMGLDFVQMDEFYRTFRISGMAHCLGGTGAWQFGQTLDAAAGSVLPGGDGLSPDRNILMAMVKWVEEGIAPDTILGTKFVNDDLSEGVQFSRRHCRFPMRNMFVGGNSTFPDSWSCR
ncbi:hypothetical protein VKT23_011128 [Stygiomarasmius scandens]|uniref:Carboxylic ester hydrolase n=1 Tax=Marasmiellus scandens TaxID=2682957 RepID=A0ABR1JCL1_9AGAR